MYIPVFSYTNVLFFQSFQLKIRSVSLCSTYYSIGNSDTTEMACNIKSMEQVTLQLVKAKRVLRLLVSLESKFQEKSLAPKHFPPTPQSADLGLCFPIIPSHWRSQMGDTASAEANRTTSRLVHYVSKDVKVRPLSSHS